jgi:membrane-anchored mycosin MYCP
MVCRAAAVAAVLMLTGPATLAGAVPPPVIDPGALPPDGPPGPGLPLVQTQACATTGVLPGSNPRVVSAAQNFMNPPTLWPGAGRGAGVTVALIDTGVSPSARLPHLRGGGDYQVAGGDGLADCDAHGTIVASIIGGAPAASDAFTGMAPDADLVSIRMYSDAYGLRDAASDVARRNLALRTLARGIVHAANMGAGVINIAGGTCIPAGAPADLAALGAAVRYAAVDKDVVIVVSAGNVDDRCPQNPDTEAATQADPRNWGGVVTVNTPAVFADYVLAVTATDDTYQPATYLDGTEMSLRGPWVGIAAPGNWVQGFNGQGDLINGKINHDTGQLDTISGTSFAAAYISGLAALMRAKFPDLTAAGVIQKIEFTAHAPLGAVTNRMGHGVVDPYAALAGDPSTAENQPAAQPNDGRRSNLIRLAGLAVVGAVIAAVVVVFARAKR